MRNRDRDRTGLGFLALAILLSACGSEPRPETPDPERFRRVEAAGPFSVAIPRELSRLPVIGVDTEVDEFGGEGLRLGFSYGMYGSVPLSDGLLDYSTGQMTVDGRRGSGLPSHVPAMSGTAFHMDGSVMSAPRHVGASVEASPWD